MEYVFSSLWPSPSMTVVAAWDSFAKAAEDCLSAASQKSRRNTSKFPMLPASICYLVSFFYIYFFTKNVFAQINFPEKQKKWTKLAAVR